MVSSDSSPTPLIGIPRGSLSTLRAILTRDFGPGAAAWLQEAGYTSAEAFFIAFQEWIVGQGRPDPSDLSVEEFESAMSEYFSAIGWGTFRIGALHDAVATLDAPDWGEAEPAQGLDTPGCHYTTGVFAYFFGRVADAPIAVLEVECRSAGAARCRFLLGSADVVMHLYGALERGETYEEAAAVIA